MGPGLMNTIAARVDVEIFDKEDGAEVSGVGARGRPVGVGGREGVVAVESEGDAAGSKGATVVVRQAEEDAGDDALVLIGDIHGLAGVHGDGYWLISFGIALVLIAWFHVLVGFVGVRYWLISLGNVLVLQGESLYLAEMIRSNHAIKEDVVFEGVVVDDIAVIVFLRSVGLEEMCREHLTFCLSLLDPSTRRLN